MPDAALPQLVIIADLPQCLTKLGGISLLERIRRIAIDLAFHEAIVLSKSIDEARAELAGQTWRSGRLSIQYRAVPDKFVAVDDVRKIMGARNLVVFADWFYDKRLVRELANQPDNCVLVDSDPAAEIMPLFGNEPRVAAGWVCGAAIVTADWLTQKNPNGSLAAEIRADIDAGRFATLDAAAQPSYVPSMRRELRPISFQAPPETEHARAERFLRDSTQKGVLDLPALVHAPIEKWIVSKISNVSITPNQITIATGVLGVCVTILYATGHVLIGVLLALAIGVLDGIDGKLARLREQTTKMGEAEHALDYCIEMSWWAALAFHFQSAGELFHAYGLWIAFFISDVIDRLAKWVVEIKFGRKLDDLAAFDRVVRSIAGRRNIYTWLFAISVFLGKPTAGFILICFWGITSTAIHVFRAVQTRIACPP